MLRQRANYYSQSLTYSMLEYILMLVNQKQPIMSLYFI